MGFLSKLFGGDAGPAPSKPRDEAAGSNAAAAPAEAGPAEAAEAQAAVPRPPELTPHAAPAREAAAAEPSQPPRPEPAAVAPKSASTSALRTPAADAVPPPRRAEAFDASPIGGRPTSKNLDRQPAPAAPAPAPAEPALAAPPVPRRPPEPARRSPQLESSIITSAPELAADPARAASAPRPVAGARQARAAEPPRPPAPVEPTPPARAPMSSVSGEGGLLAGSRTRKDRTKSPGFYSNMAPAYGSQTVSSSLAQSSLKRTTVGVAPPPAPAPTAGAEATVKAPADPAPVTPQRPLAADVNGAEAAAHMAPDAAPLAAAAANDVLTGTEVAPAREAPDDELEKEETAPGVGHMPSRHDPALRSEIAERDLELLVQFGMDLGLGIATEAWLTVAREAIIRLKLTAIGLSRGPLDKALAQLGFELEAPSELGDERRSRIMQHLVLVDLALPRPIDLSGQRQLRERLIVQHLLAELSATQPLIAQRLREDSSLSLERLSRSSAAELAARVGLDAQQSEQALAQFRDYLDERSRRGPEAAQIGKGRLLAQRLADLEASAEQFERVADGDDAMAKREARRRRQSDIARVSLFLAEWGEAGVLAEFERSSVQGKIARLRRWLTELPAS